MANLLPKFVIVEPSTSKLILKHHSGILFNLFMIFWSLGFGGLPLGMLVFIASEFGVTTLSCQRVEPKLVDCVWSESKYLGLVPKISDQPIKQVTDAKLESAEWSNRKGGGTAKVWVSLITKSSKTRLFETQYAIESGFKPKFQPEATQKIKAFINSPASSFKIEQDTRLSGSFWGGLIFVLPFTLIGLLVLYASVRSQTITVDKTSNLYMRQIHTILGTRTKKYTIGDIQSVEVTEHLDRYRRRWYQLMIVLRSGKKYKLPAMINRNRVQEVADRVRKFLGLP
jgi:hypothetical protein